MFYKFSYHGSIVIVPITVAIVEITDKDVIILTVINSLKYYGVKDLVVLEEINAFKAIIKADRERNENG